jgi:hypothetical protein
VPGIAIKVSLLYCLISIEIGPNGKTRFAPENSGYILQEFVECVYGMYKQFYMVKDL